MHYVLHSRHSDPSAMWIIHEDDSRDSGDQVVVQQVTSEPPDNHLWKAVLDSRELVDRSDVLETYKHVEIEL